MAHEAKILPPAPNLPASPSRMTYEEFLALDEEGARLEWVDGEVERMSPVTDEHQELAGFLLSLLRAFVEARQLGVVRFEPFQMKTAPNLPGRSPDLFFVANEHRSRITKMHLKGPADMVVEIISPDSRRRDRKTKFGEYEQGGVREYWLLDQPRKQAEFYQLGEDGRYHPMPVGEDSVFHSGVLPGLWLKVEWLWQDPHPPVLSVLREWGLI
jgi:Uma2 family endonuclease